MCQGFENAIFSILFDFRSSFWNFPVTAWWSHAIRQSTQASDPFFWVFFMKRLEAEDDPPSNAN